jgi:hypothetical protein
MADERPRAGPIQAPRPERQIAFRTGISAESRAAAFLIAKGFRILARRWKSPVGEIDIVARRRSLLLFVEVKARERLDDAAWSVTESPALAHRRSCRGLAGAIPRSSYPRYPFRCHAGGARAYSAPYPLGFRRQQLMRSGDSLRSQKVSSGE